ncbi:MAG TPA: transcription-repair coupling factor [Anaerolineae bacterium]|nr:transcription-repair coupling factor [Anaerolineae bacterium]HQH38695.1 transcription-repair coupling factor [Anaerolineae bacterium]
MSTLLHGLLTWVQEHPAYQALRDALKAGLELPACALLPHARPPVIAGLCEDLHVPTVIIMPTVDESRQLAEALKLWLADPTRLRQFPEPPVLFYERAPWTPEAITDRLDVLSKLFMYRLDTAPPEAPPVVVTSVRALMQRTLPYRQFRHAARKIEVNARESLTGLARHAAGIGYEPVSVVQAPGQFSRRGGLLDIYPPQAPAPYRLEFFGDVIDTIRPFDPATQRSAPEAGRIEEFWLTPVREALPLDGAHALATVRTMLNGELPADVRTLLEADAQALEAALPFPNLEFYLPYFYQEIGSLLHYLPANALVITGEAEKLAERWRELEEEAEEQRQQIMEEGYLPPTAGLPYITWEAIRERLERPGIVALNTGEEGPLAEGFTAEVHFAGRLPEALGRIRQWLTLNDQVVVVSRQAERMAELWQDFNPPPVQPSVPTAPVELLTFVQGAAPGGWQWNGPHGARHLITDEELFGWRPPEPRRRPRRRATAPEFNFADLQPGDPVVHEDYGIGIFRGLVTRSIDDIEREYLLLEYAAPTTSGENNTRGSDKLYVPIHQADRLTRYIGVEDAPPQLNRLDGTAWAQTKARVEEAAHEVAVDLLELYAARQVVQGHAFAPDAAWQHELEAAFPYVETEDQAQAIKMVKEDMEKTRPMDRLICGDAGYGKTEVALRAAFKAVMDGKQVAMLVPTTVLAQQHHETFRERLAPFPVTVELLSRFRTDAEQRQVLAGLREGKVDIVIGTHRLLQQDVAFKDLGLVIIDEEQRFGVTHKERLKKMRTEVDVLTMTATPIPRTLYMALAGARDVSIIETPPQERLPIATYTGPYDSDVTRRAILRELKRGGQVFYVHNRVESIHAVAERLRSLVPEARIAVAHGQMQERELARVMRQFATAEIDVLLATTIIESGLDFPNANTLIVERADRFGLAQLYQLRGRVGRGTRRGYTYFFHKRRMNDEARARLQALDEALGSGGGFTVALRDLEIRGAGELLGRNQHGHVANVGFTLYTRILARAVQRLKAAQAGEPEPPEPIGSITIELPLAVGLPAEYIPDDKLRLQLYRRMAELTTAEAIGQLQDELHDRFGPLPPEAQNLIYQLQLKILARDARIPAIVVENGQIALRPTWLKRFDPGKIAHLRRRLGELARVGRQEIWLPLAWEEARWRNNLHRVLEILGEWWAEGNEPTHEPMTEGK